jgi:hypothetical protein
MPGGLLNIVSEGNNNVILNGNPTKTFFTVTYSKYTNFGLQKFRLDYEGSRDLRTSTPSQFKFKIKRYAELLMDTYLVVNLPDIWSPFHEPTIHTSNLWVPYEFKWIKNLGTQMIKEVLITCGSVTIQKYTGDYLQAMVDRDFSGTKKDLFDKMSGNVPELNDPANAFGKSNIYPSAFYTDNSAGSEPSIRARQILIPINAWFTLDNRCAFPLVCLQYNELEITITLRPIQELFQIRDIYDNTNNFPYMQPDFNRQEMQMYHFLQSPPSVFVDNTVYTNTSNVWNADIHLLCTYCFLSKAETELFAAKDQVYLVKDVFNYNFENITGSSRVKLTSNGLVSSWMWYLQRNDVNTRNEWSNYSNWPYDNIPQNVLLAPETLPVAFQSKAIVNGIYSGPGINNNNISGFFYTGDFNVANQKEILQTFGILLNGEYRENTLPSSVFNYVEKYTRTQGFAKEGLYCYNFCLNTDPFEYQPSGALNMSKFKTVELEITTYSPPIDAVKSNFQILYDTDGIPINTNKQAWQLYQYNYNMIVFEERYNILTFMGGNCGMLYSR